MNSPVFFLLDNQWSAIGLVAIILLGITEVGYRLGLSLHRARDEARKSQIAGMQGAVLGLLGLLLGFTFSMGINRYETRRDLVLKEANVIGTAWLRAGLLPEAHREPVKNLLSRYTDLRLEMQRLSYSRTKVLKTRRQAVAIENELWKHAEAAAIEAPTPITATFVTALNALIDTESERVTAHRNRIPLGVWALLILVAAAGCLISAYGAGANGRRSFLTATFLPLLISFVMMLIFDLLHPHQGFIGLTEQPILELKASMAAPPR